MTADRRSPIGSGAHRRSWICPAFCALLLALLLALRGWTLVGHFLTNLTSLALFPRWQAVAEASAILHCPEEGASFLATSLLETALRLASGNPQAWLYMGRVRWLEGRCREAAEAWRTAIDLNPSDPAAWLLYLQARPEEATRPESGTVQRITEYAVFQGDGARKEEEWERALEWYEWAFSLAPGKQTAGRLENVYLQLGRKEEAIAKWQGAARRLPEDDPDHWWARGRAAELAENWEEAAHAYGQGIPLAASPYDFLMRQGYAYERLQDWEQAEAVYRQAVQARPHLLWPYLGVGHTYRARKNYEEALAWYRQAETLSPGRLDPKYHIGYTHYLRQDYRTAQEYFHRSLQINPRHAWSAYWLAKCLRQMGEREEAIGWLRSAIQWYGKQPWNWAVELGDWLAEAGDREGALAAYRQALEWKPGDERIQAKIRALEEW